MNNVENEMELGTRLTFLNDTEAKEFLEKYDKIIFLESKKRAQLPGISNEDLAQACREKLLAGFHLFDENKSSEKTWVVNVIKKTLNGIWNQAFKKKRVNSIPDQEGNDVPVRDYSFETYKEDSGFLLEESYEGPPDCRPAFGDSPSSSAEEYLQVLQALQFLKTKLSQEAYSLIREELLPGLDDHIEKIRPPDPTYQLKEPEEYKIWSIFSGMEETEIQILNQIGDFFVHVLGFNKEQILSRTKTIDIKIS